MAHGYSSRYSIIEFSAAVDTLRGPSIRRKLGLNGEPYIKRFSCIRYIVEISQLTAAVMASGRHCSNRRRIILARMAGGSVGGIVLKVHRTKF